jgi:hypothetical protein
MDDIIVRYTPPSRYDKAEFGKICKLVDDDTRSIFYVQINTDIEHPEWIKTSDLLELTFKNFVQDPFFISACLNLLKGPIESKTQHVNTIIDYIKSYLS